VRGYDKDNQPWTDFGLENSWFLPMKGAALPGERTTHLLDLIERSTDNPRTRPSNLEAISYLPGVFWPWGRHETAWRWMRHLMEAPLADREYPEISYTLVSHVVEGMAGVEPDAGARRFQTLSRLPDSVQWLAVDGIPVGNATLDIRHDRRTRSTVRVSDPDGKRWVWSASFAGDRFDVKVDGKRRRARTVTVNGVALREVEVPLTDNRPVVVERI